MCGIAGYISRDKDSGIADKINIMLEKIIYRGPDGGGNHVHDQRVGLGHRRLSIIDLSDNAGQPMCYRDRYWLTYNGEIYNYIELRNELKEQGYTFSTESDTEVLLASFDYWGKDCVAHFNGMWSFALFDEKNEKLFCSRDRYGVKPFYYYTNGQVFIFGSEIKEILAVYPEECKADMDNLAVYLTKGSLDRNDGTMFANIKQLIGGFNLFLDCRNLSCEIKEYYDLRKIRIADRSKETNYIMFREKFMQSVGFRLRSDVQIGSCLSGGLDSSSIVCAVHKELEGTGNAGKQYTVSSCFEDKRYDEQEFIDEVVKDTGVTAYKVFPEMEKLFDELDKLIWHMDEPFASTSIYAQWNVFRKAKEKGLTVMLDGQGSDEQLAGYTPFYQVLFVNLLRRGKFRQLFHEINCYRTLRSESEPIRIGEILLSTLASALLPEGLHFKANRLYVRRLRGLPFPKHLYDNEKARSEFAYYNKKDPQEFIYAGMTQGLRALLHYEDRNSMAHSIESRVPFLDYELVEFIYSVPFSQKIENGRTKNLLREGLKDILPTAIYNRISKLGFVTTEDKWLKENEEFFYHELEKACDRLSAILDKKQVLEWYKTHVQSTRRGDSTCFRIICAAHWANVFNVCVG